MKFFFFLSLFSQLPKDVPAPSVLLSRKSVGVSQNLLFIIWNKWKNIFNSHSLIEFKPAQRWWVSDIVDSRVLTCAESSLGTVYADYQSRITSMLTLELAHKDLTEWMRHNILHLLHNVVQEKVKHRRQSDNVSTGMWRAWFCIQTGLGAILPKLSSLLMQINCVQWKRKLT